MAGAMNSSKLAISVYITDDQYNTLRVSEKTTAGKVCSMVARKRNLKKSIKYALFLQHGEGHETRLRSDQSIVKTIDRVRRTTDAVRVGNVAKRVVMGAEGAAKRRPELTFPRRA